jgi:hypothetical protein
MSRPTFKRKRVFGGRRQKEAEPVEDAVVQADTGDHDAKADAWTGVAGFRSMKKFKIEVRAPTAAAEPVAVHDQRVEPVVSEDGSDGPIHDDVRMDPSFDARPLAAMYDLALSDAESEGEARAVRPARRPEVQPLAAHTEYLQDHLFVLKEHLEMLRRNVDSLTTRRASASATKLQLLRAIAEG